MDIEQLHRYFLDSKGVSTDTREDLSEKLFFALKGDNFDGNRYADRALEAGADWAIVDNDNLQKKSRFIFVDDALEALQQLATYHRRFLGLPIIAITGSNGKTTTKELVAAVLAQQFKVSFTQGNFNNHIGVPLTLLAMDKSTTIGVVEMGANHQREIARLCEIAQPDFGYITNFGKAHLEGFGGIEGVIKGKSELYDYLKAHRKKMIVNADDPLEMAQSDGGNRILFGEEADCAVRFENASPFVEVSYQNKRIYSRLMGRYNANNMAAAICVGQLFDLSADLIKTAIEGYVPTNNRSQIVRQGTLEIVLDAYNANPTSMKLAVENFEDYPANRRVAILGDMFEIGATALEEHQAIVDYLEQSSLDEAYVCGVVFGNTNTRRVHKFKDFQQLKKAVAVKQFHDEAVLIKGSRGMGMERLLEVL